MVTRQELQGKWSQVKGQIREKWGEFTDDELQKVKGDGEQLIGLIQQKSGAARREIESFLDDAIHEGRSMLDQAGQTARQYATQAGEAVRDTYQRAEEQLGAGYEDAQEMVRARPVESIGVAFGAGLIAGVVVSLMLRPSRS